MFMVSCPSIMILNIQALNSHIDGLRSFLVDPSTNRPFIIAVLEAQIPPAHIHKFAIIGYNCLHLPSDQSINHQSNRGTPGGGIVIYWRAGVMLAHRPNISLNRLGNRVADPDYGRTCCSHWFECQPHPSSPSLILNIAYISPAANSYSQAMCAYLDNLRSALPLFDQKPVIAAGDFNARSSYWDPRSPVPISQQASSLEAAMLTELDLTLLNNEFADTRSKPTRPSSLSILDLCFVNYKALSLIRSFELGHALFADHLPLHITLNFRPPLSHQPAAPLTWKIYNNPSKWQSKLPALVDHHVTNDVSLIANLNNMRSINQANQSSPQSIIQMTWKLFLAALNRAMSLCIKQTARSQENYFWFDGPVKAQHEKLCRSRQQWRQHRLSSSHLSYLAQYRVEQAKFRTVAIKSRADAMRRLYESILPSASSPLLWTAIARMRKSKGSHLSASIPNLDGSMPTSPTEGLNNLCRQYVDFTLPERPLQHNVKHHLSQFMSNRSPSTLPHCSDSWSWSGEEVKQQCCWQRNQKSAAGPDNIPPLVLKHFGNVTYQALSTIFSYSWHHGVLPTHWTEANVFSLLKDPSKSMNDANNFRPISVTSIFIRTFEHLIHKKLVSIIDSPNIPLQLLYAHQYGFRQNRSCDNALHLVTSSINEEQRKRHTGSNCLLSPVVFIDLKKAFDRVWHQSLMQTLSADFSITGRAWKWIWRWLHCKRRIRCVSQADMSDWHRLGDHGVPQGAVLSPLLFILFINQIANEISVQCPLINMPMFADDVALLAKSSAQFETWWRSSASRRDRSKMIINHSRTVKRFASKERPEIQLFRELCQAQQMQRALTLFSNWLARVGMQANSAKTKVVVFSSAAPRNHSWMSPQSINQNSHWFHRLVLDGFTIQPVHQYKYLGLTLDSNMRWTTHIENVSKKANIASATICRLFSSQQHCPHPAAALKLVKSLVIPIITYGIHFWLLTEPSQSTHSDAIDNLHTIIIRPLRMAADLPRTTHRLGTMIDFGLSSLHDYARQSLARFYLKYGSVTIHQSAAVQQLIQNKQSMYSHHAINTLHPSINRIIQDCHFQQHIKSGPLVQHKKWTTTGARARFVAIPHMLQTIQTSRSNPSLCALVSDLPPAPDARLAAQQQQSQLNITQFAEAHHMPLISQLGTFLAWKSQSHSINPHHARVTNAPLVAIKQQPGAALILRYVENHRALRTLMRLRHGRAFTHDVRVRFPSASLNPSAQQAVITPFCKNPPCLAAQVNDSVHHVLIDCPRHLSHRIHLLSSWSAHSFGAGTLHQLSDLTLSLLLGESPTKHIKPINQSTKTKFSSWYLALSTFIIAVYQSLPVCADYPKPL